MTHQLASDWINYERERELQKEQLQLQLFREEEKLSIQQSAKEMQPICLLWMEVPTSVPCIEEEPILKKEKIRPISYIRRRS